MCVCKVFFESITPEGIEKELGDRSLAVVLADILWLKIDSVPMLDIRQELCLERISGTPGRPTRVFLQIVMHMDCNSGALTSFIFKKRFTNRLNRPSVIVSPV